MEKQTIFIKGAREHNLKNIDLELPRNQFIVITGLSGSGKSSLAFDTIFAEGQRRYVESLSAYARQFLGQMEKPDVDYIEGLSPAISIDQKGSSKNPRSTVGTVTEIYDYLRLLFARIGIPHCPKCQKPIKPQSIDQMTDKIMEMPQGSKIQLLSPIVRGRKGEYQGLLTEIRQKGFARVRVDGSIYNLSEEITLEKNKKHNIEVVIDRLVIKESIKRRLSDSLELTLKLSGGLALVAIDGDEKETLFNENLTCFDCNISYEELQPRLFSFNSPFGACPSCTGIGYRLDLAREKVVPYPEKSINEGAIAPWGAPVKNFRYQPMESWHWKKLWDVARHLHFNFDTPFKNLSEEQQDAILLGYHDIFEGIISNLERRYRETDSEMIRDEIEKYMLKHPCADCEGTRLKPQARSVLVDNYNICKITSLSIKDSITFFENISLTERETIIARQVLKEIKSRLSFLANVGLEYLTLDRTSATLSGGEAQRIRLATQIGSGLVGVLYILDEPSIGLHQRDNRRLLNTLKNLRDLGNTLIVVEHDEETIKEADFVVDIGPGAGRYGGEIVAAGTPESIMNCKESITGKYLNGELFIKTPEKRRKPNGKFLKILGASHNNLKNIDVEIPLGLFVCITGVSGSGKSSLIDEILYRALAKIFYASSETPGKYREIQGHENIDKVIIIDQSPIGRTPRSNPATYTGLFSPVREVFSKIPESKMRGYKPGRFSFNVKGGRCESCQGQGILQIEMHFLPDVYVPCEVCKGKRYNRETLQVLFKGKNIAEVLDLTVSDALEFFDAIPIIKRKLETLKDVGLGYIHLGQSATTLSGGEAQRIKLATELSKRATGKTLYILDEPTTGLHFDDVAKLLTVLDKLVSSGNTILIIEHNLDIIKHSDYIIDLGPDGGDGGGYITAKGTPENVSKVKNSYTGQYLKKMFGEKNEKSLNNKMQHI